MIAAAPALPSYNAIVPPRADRYIRFHGREILRGVGFLKGSVIKCPDGHVVHPGMMREGVLFCGERPARGQAQCGALIYMLCLPSHGDPTHRIWLADVTHAEWRQIERMGLDADGVLAYFGASFER